MTINWTTVQRDSVFRRICNIFSYTPCLKIDYFMLHLKTAFSKGCRCLRPPACNFTQTPSSKWQGSWSSQQNIHMQIIQIQMFFFLRMRISFQSRQEVATQTWSGFKLQKKNNTDTHPSNYPIRHDSKQGWCDISFTWAQQEAWG